MSSAGTLAGSQGKVVSSQRTRPSPPLCVSRALGWFPRPCVGCHSRLPLQDTRWQMEKQLGVGQCQHLGSSGPRVPPGVGSGPLEWPQIWSFREERLTFPLAPSPPIQQRLPEGFPNQLPGPRPQAHLFKSSLFSDLSFMKSLQFFLLNQLFCCFLQLPSSSECLPLL